MGRTSKGDEISPMKMPLMRIRSVEIIFEDELTCTDTGLLDRSLELALDSDDSTKCVDDLEQLHPENEDSVTLNAEADLSDDNSYSSKEPIGDITKTNENNTKINVATEDALSLNVSEFGDSGRFTEEASSSHIQVYDDAVLSKSFDTVNVNDASTMMSVYEMSEASNKERLYEYVDSNSDSSDSTAICDGDIKIVTLPEVIVEDTLCDSYDLQYDSFVDIGKF